MEKPKFTQLQQDVFEGLNEREQSILSDYNIGDIGALVSNKSILMEGFIYKFRQVSMLIENYS